MQKKVLVALVCVYLVAIITLGFYPDSTLCLVFGLTVSIALAWVVVTPEWQRLRAQEQRILKTYKLR